MKTIRMYKMMPFKLFEETLEKWGIKAAEPYNSLIPMETLPQFSGALHKENCILDASNCRYVFMSFTTNVESPVMWGLYAERGSGVCLVFDFPVGISSRPNVVARFPYVEEEYTEEGIFELNRVKYRKDNTRYKVSKKMSLYPAQWQMALLLNKPLSCSFEEEYRIVKPVIDSNGCSGVGAIFHTPLQHLTGVIAGPSCPHSPEVLRAMIKHYKKKHYEKNNVEGEAKDFVLKAHRAMYDDEMFKLVIKK